ncbi:MAG TPA: type II CAAX endopeptidase family protein [Minicystis sp.]|nr:type II CAAX endopeptidase family protein [Minicystis sp.]
MLQPLPYGGGPSMPAFLQDQVPSLGSTLLKMVFPFVGYLVLAPALWFFFRRTWRELDVDAHQQKAEMLASGRYDYRPAAVFVITAAVLTLQEYYGQPRFYEDYIRPALRNVELAQLDHPGGLGQLVHLGTYGALYAYGFWAATRVAGYVLLPLVAWKILFPKDSLLDMGLRTRGLRSHAWIYGLCLVVVLPAVYLASRSPEFADYYPFYKSCSRSWADLLGWELMYAAQFFALEIFFRGFMLSGLRKSLGSGAIFAMCVPYCMIHYGKPYFETCGAVVAGIALGSLAMKTKSIYSGFFVHVTVALSMDLLAIAQRGGLPHRLWA